MKKLLQLDDFSITKLHVDWCVAGKESAGVDENPYFEYKVLRNPKNKREFAMFFSAKLYTEKDPEKSGYIIESAIFGIFSFAQEATEREMQVLIRINGATILYGILRGQIAAVTGSFPGKKFVLPAVYMQEIIPKIDARKTRKELKIKKKPIKKVKAGRESLKKVTTPVSPKAKVKAQRESNK